MIISTLMLFGLIKYKNFTIYNNMNMPMAIIHL